MSRKSVILLTVLFAAPLLVYLLWPSDEQRIKKLFREGARAVEAEKTEDVMAKVSFTYTDDHGISYMLLKELLQKAFAQLEKIKVEYEITSLKVKEGTAGVEVDVRVIASHEQDTGYIAGDAARAVHMKFTLEKERGKWLVAKTQGFPATF